MGDTPGRTPSSDDFSNFPIARSSAAHSPNPGLYIGGEVKSVPEGSAQRRTSHTNFSPTQPYSPQGATHGREDPFNMSFIGGALPDSNYQNYGPPPQRFPTGAPPTSLYQMQNQHYNVSPALAQNVQYGMQYQTQYAGMYPSSQTSPLPYSGQGAGLAGPYYQGQAFAGHSQQQPYFIPQGQYATQSQIYPSNAMMIQSPGRGTSIGDHRFPSAIRSNESLAVSSNSPGAFSGRSNSNGKPSSF